MAAYFMANVTQQVNRSFVDLTAINKDCFYYSKTFMWTFKKKFLTFSAGQFQFESDSLEIYLM